MNIDILGLNRKISFFSHTLLIFFPHTHGSLFFSPNPKTKNISKLVFKREKENAP